MVDVAEIRRVSVYKWMRAKRAAGLCRECGQVPFGPRSTLRCDGCQDKHCARQRARRQTASEKAKHVARESIRQALKYGRLERPSVCDQCGEPGRIEAHHGDHRQTRNVTWLCKTCHGKTHRHAQAG